MTWECLAPLSKPFHVGPEEAVAEAVRRRDAGQNDSALVLYLDLIEGRFGALADGTAQDCVLEALRLLTQLERRGEAEQLAHRALGRFPDSARVRLFLERSDRPESSQGAQSGVWSLRRLD